MTKPTDTDALEATQQEALNTLQKLSSMLAASGVDLPQGLGEHVAAQADKQNEPSPASASEVERGLPIDWSTEGKAVFANGLQVLHRPSDFALLFTDETPFPGRHAAGHVKGEELAAVSASLRVPPAAMFQMIGVLASSWNRFVSSMPEGAPKQPRFRMIDSEDMQLDDAEPSL